MSQEKILSDFSGGINALAAVDKLDPKECLLAENVRLDETGNVQSAGAYTHQNTAAYAASAGTNANSVHSLFWNPSLGGVAGVGQDVFTGRQLGKLSSALTAKNPNQQKMSSASAPNRVYFDVGSQGYWSDMTNLLTVDWAPPSISSAVVSTATGTFGTATTNAASGFGFALSTASSMDGLTLAVVATTTIIFSDLPLGSSGTETYAVQANLMVAGSPVGTGFWTTVKFSGANGTSIYTSTYTFGNANNLWGYPTLTPSQVNASNFGFILTYTDIGGPGNSSINPFSYSKPVCVTYQAGAGMVANTGAAGTLTGTYSWKVTFVAVNGEESDGSADSTNVVCSSQQGTLTAIPTGDARTVSRNIYRKGYATSTPLTSHYLVGSIPDNVTTVYSDNLTDIAALTEGVILAGDVPGDYPNSRLGNLPVRFPCYHYDRVFWVNQNQPNEIVWSKPLNGFAYPVINFIDVGDSKPITRLISIFGELIIIKTDSIWRLTGTDESSFDLTQTPSAVGTDESFTVEALPDKILFANRWGLWVFNGYTSQPLTTKMDLWFKQNDRTGKSIFGINGFHPIEVVSPSIPMNFDGAGNSEKFYLAYAEAGQTQNNALLAFDVKHGNITKRSTGSSQPLSLAIDPVTGYVYMGDQNGFISLLDDWNGANGGGAPVNFDFQHGYQDFQRGSNKRIPALEFYLDTNGQSLIPYIYYDGGTSSETLPAISTTGLQRVVRPLQAQASRKAQNISVRLNGNLSAVNASGTPQVQIVHIKVFYDVYTGRPRTGQ